MEFITPNEDICRFVVKNGFVISGGRKASISVWDKTNAKKLCFERNLHLNDINCVDFCRTNLIISGSKDQTIKFWSLISNNYNRKSVLRLKNTIEVNERVWDLSSNDSQNCVLVGNACCGRRKPLITYDIETYES